MGGSRCDDARSLPRRHRRAAGDGRGDQGGGQRVRCARGDQRGRVQRRQPRRLDRARQPLQRRDLGRGPGRHRLRDHEEPLHDPGGHDDCGQGPPRPREGGVRFRSGRGRRGPPLRQRRCHRTRCDIVDRTRRHHLGALPRRHGLVRRDRGIHPGLCERLHRRCTHRRGVAGRCERAGARRQERVPRREPQRARCRGRRTLGRGERPRPASPHRPAGRWVGAGRRLGRRQGAALPERVGTGGCRGGHRGRRRRVRGQRTRQRQQQGQPPRGAALSALDVGERARRDGRVEPRRRSAGTRSQRGHRGSDLDFGRMADRSRVRRCDDGRRVRPDALPRPR